MAKKEKKVVILLVEGESDEALLIERLRELFLEYEIRFEPQHGDILYHNQKRTKPIKEIIGDTVRAIMMKRKFKKSDILAVLHIIDTDGSLIKDNHIIIDSSQKELTFYQDDCIRVTTEQQKNNIITRNSVRARNIRTMNSVQSIVANQYSYQMYYFSRNLEHVVLNEPNPDSDEKVDNIECFLDDLEIPLEEYLSNFMPIFTQQDYSIKYTESWGYVGNELNSLMRCTNVPLLIDFIKMKS